MAQLEPDEREFGTRPRTEDLETLIAVVDYRGLGAAARALEIPKSTVSRRLDRLETTLGLQLLHRGGRLVRPTDQGVQLVDRARDALVDLDAIVACARGGRDAPRGVLRASAPADLSAFDEVWLSFLTAHPLVELQLEFTNRYVDVVREGFDLAIRGGRGEDESLITRRLGSYALRAVASPSWVASHGRLREPKDLRSTSCVLLHGFRGAGASRAGHHQVFNHIHMVREACLRGLGVAILPAPFVETEVTGGRLVTVLDAYDPLMVPLYAVFPQRRFLPASTAALLDHVAAAFTQNI